jgi:hypothetical protein
MFEPRRGRCPRDIEREADHIAESIDALEFAWQAAGRVQHANSAGHTCKPRGGAVFRLFLRIKPVGLTRCVCGSEFHAQDGRGPRVQNMGRGLRAGNGNAMKRSHQTTPAGGMRRLGTVFIRMAVGLLLGSAITVAVVAAGLDLFPLWP